MKLEQSFEVDAPLKAVWAALIDVQQVAPCLPGAELTEVGDDGTYHGTFSVKIGPAKASYRGQMTMEAVDEAAHEVTMRATGADKRGQGGAKATMHSKLSARDGGGTHVAVTTDMTITGRLASFSRGGMIEDVSNRLLGEFATCLQAKLATEPEPEPEGGTEPFGGGVPVGGGAPKVVPETASAPAPDAGAPATPASPAPQRPAPPQAAKPISGISLVLGVLRDRLRRLVRRARR